MEKPNQSSLAEALDGAIVENEEDAEVVAWSVGAWAKAVGLSTQYIRMLIRQQKITSVKAGTRRLITTKPREYLDTLEQQDGVAYTPRGRPVQRV